MIRDLPLVERPREKCETHGVETLSIRELLALLLGSGPRGKGALGSAADFLEGFCGKDWNEESFFSMFSSLQSSEPLSPFFGWAQRCRILAAVEIARRYQEFCRKSESLLVQNTKTISQFRKAVFKKISLARRASSQEWVGFVVMTRAGKLTSLVIVQEGVENAVTLCLMDLLAAVLMYKPVCVFLFHNHPQGSTTASQDDLDLTVRVSDVLSQVGITQFEHWIVTQKEFARVVL